MNHTIDFQELMDYTDDICLSIYLPTHPTHPEQQSGDRLQLRDLLDEARTQIAQFTPFLRPPDIERLLEPATQLLEQDGDFWTHQTGGLALFLATEFSRVYCLPLVVEPLVMVSGRFYLRPLLPLLAGDGRFYLLALSQNQARFFGASQHHLDEIVIPNMPTNLAELLVYDQPEKQLQFHGAASAPGVAGGRGAIFYSVDEPTNYKKKSLLRYCQAIDASLQHRLRQESAPLVLACVDYLFAIYQQANSYPHLYPQWVAGSPDRVNNSTLHEEAWGLVQPLFQQTRQEAITRFEALLGQGRALTEVGRIVTAAFAGRVTTLFVAAMGQKWGSFNSQTGEVYLQEFDTPHSQELLNLATIYTLNNGGTVYTCQPDELPDGIELAALPRY
jgi:hypothetical protein